MGRGRQGTWTGWGRGYVEVETGVLISVVVEGEFEVMEVAIDEFVVIHLLLALLLLPLLLLHRQLYNTYIYQGVRDAYRAD